MQKFLIDKSSFDSTNDKKKKILNKIKFEIIYMIIFFNIYIYDYFI